jgi:hypothetical protein
MGMGAETPRWPWVVAEESPQQLGSRVPADPAARCVPAPSGGGGSCQKMSLWPRAAAAAAAFIFKLPSGQRARRRGRGPRPAASLILGLPGPWTSLPPRPCRVRSIPWGAPGPGSACGLLSMAASSLGGLEWREVSAAAAAAARGQDRGPATHHAQPAEQTTTGRQQRPRKVEAGGLRGSELPAAQCLSVRSGGNPFPCPAPAQSRPRPNPIVPPGLGLASLLAHTKCDAGRAAPAAPRDPATAGPPRTSHLRPGERLLESPDAPSTATTEGTLRLREDTFRDASPCGRTLVRAAREKTM